MSDKKSEPKKIIKIPEDVCLALFKSKDAKIIKIEHGISASIKMK